MLRVDHPARRKVHAVAGHDPVVGLVIDIMSGGHVIASYDCFDPLFNRSRPLIGCLDFLVSQGFFTGDELEHAAAHLA